MKISPFTPLFFGGCANLSDGVRSRHRQVFADTDQILIEVIAETGDTAPTAVLYNACDGEAVGSIDWSQWQMNDDKLVFFHVYKGLSNGIYYLVVGGYVSEPFLVTSESAVLDGTTLIQYRFKDNRQREDVVSVIDLMPYFFDWRVPGGFKDGGWSFGVTNEQFTTQYEDVVELYARDYTLKTFTLGNAGGVPVRYGEMLNRVLTCSYVYFNGTRYTRSDAETPSLNVQVEGKDSFVFTQVLRKAQLLDPELEELNRLCIRRVDDDYVRIVDTTNSELLIIE